MPNGFILRLLKHNIFKSGRGQNCSGSIGSNRASPKYLTTHERDFENPNHISSRILLNSIMNLKCLETEWKLNKEISEIQCLKSRDIFENPIRSNLNRTILILLFETFSWHVDNSFINSIVVLLLKHCDFVSIINIQLV